MHQAIKLRIAMALVLTIQALLGPSLCCCAFMMPAPAKAAGATAAKHTPGSCHCCVHPCQDSAPMKEQTPNEPCPCPEDCSHQQVALSALPDTEKANLQFNDIVASSVCTVACDLCHVPMILVEQPDRDTSFLSAEDLIDVHHVMRC